MTILTHRGLRPSRSDFYTESSREAFHALLSDDYGIEFDIAFTADNQIVISHDKSLSRLTRIEHDLLIEKLSYKEILRHKYPNGSIATFNHLTEMIKNSNARYSALHLKSRFQLDNFLNVLIERLSNESELLNRLIIFDVKPKTAEYLLRREPKLLLAPSVAHDYDVLRYNDAVEGTLLKVSDIEKYLGLYQWVWLDEWDRIGEGSSDKIFYTRDLFSKLRKMGLMISLVTPELHGTSPHLLGSESHADAKTLKRLFNRIKDIITLEPDAVCTDYPDEVKLMINQSPR